VLQANDELHYPDIWGNVGYDMSCKLFADDHSFDSGAHAHPEQHYGSSQSLT